MTLFVPVPDGDGWYMFWLEAEDSLNTEQQPAGARFITGENLSYAFRKGSGTEDAIKLSVGRSQTPFHSEKEKEDARSTAGTSRSEGLETGN